jgi:hypothetical protein
MSEVTVYDPKVVPLKAGGKVTAIIPQSVEEVFRIAKAIASSGLAPNGMKSVEQITVAIMHGAEIGLPPMQAIQRIAVVNGRPTIWGDAIPALLLSRGFRIREWDNETTSYCEITRPDGTKIERSFSDADAKAAGLLGKAGPWTQYKRRMRQMRARGYAARDGAADVLAGLYLNEEMSDIDTAPKRKSSAECKRDGTEVRFNLIRQQISAATSTDDLDRIEADHEADIATMAARWADIVNDEMKHRREILSAPTDQASVLREIERALAVKSAEDVRAEFSTAIMAMDEDGRAAALDMIDATAAE